MEVTTYESICKHRCREERRQYTHLNTLVAQAQGRFERTEFKGCNAHVLRNLESGITLEAFDAQKPNPLWVLVPLEEPRKFDLYCLEKEPEPETYPDDPQPADSSASDPDPDPLHERAPPSDA